MESKPARRIAQREGDSPGMRDMIAKERQVLPGVKVDKESLVRHDRADGRPLGDLVRRKQTAHRAEFHVAATILDRLRRCSMHTNHAQGGCASDQNDVRIRGRPRAPLGKLQEYKKRMR